MKHLLVLGLGLKEVHTQVHAWRMAAWAAAHPTMSLMRCTHRRMRCTHAHEVHTQAHAAAWTAEHDMHYPRTSLMRMSERTLHQRCTGNMCHRATGRVKGQRAHAQES